LARNFGTITVIVAVQHARAQPSPTVLDVYSSVTGQVVASVNPPAPGLGFQAVAALGNDRTFVAAASPAGHHPLCVTFFYRFTLGPRGQPGVLEPLPPLPKVAGYMGDNSSLAVSADGRVLAYWTRNCSGRLTGQVGVIHLATRQVRTWTTAFPTFPRSLSLSANGALLAFISDQASGPQKGDPFAASAWVLPASSPPGPLASRYRKALHWPGGVAAAVLSRTGRVLYAVTPDGSFHRAVGAYDAATGRPIRLLDVLPRPFIFLNGLTADVSGGSAIVYQLRLSRVYDLNLVTGRLRPVLVDPITPPLGVAW
jgi:hypothetical protein